MNGYLYIQSFFKAILQQSKQIQGRLIALPQGDELNYDNFKQIIEAATTGYQFPLVAWRAPASSGNFSAADEWEKYRFEFFFLNTTYYTANKVSKKNKSTGVSDKPVVEEWEEMKVAATDFIRVLQLVQKGQNNESINMLNNLFRLEPGSKKFIDPVSFVGSARLSGVRLAFEAAVWTTCAIQDYVEGGIVVLPPSDESTFEPELIVVRNEVINIVEELGLADGSMNYVIDAGNSVIATGLKGYIEWGFDALITGWTILSSITGSIVVDVWKDSYGNFEPTVDDSIAGSEKPTLTNQKKNQDLTLTSFSTTVAKGDIWAINVDSVTDVKKVTIAFRFTKQF